MVEFALCFPILLLFSISSIGVAHAEETANDLATVVRDGARYASINPASYGSSSSCASGSTACAANTIQGVIQAEANSVNQSAGGVTLANTNCLWSGSMQPPALSATPAAPSTPADASASCMTIAYYTSELLGTNTPLPCAYYSTSASAFTNLNGSNCAAASSLSAPIFVEVIVAVAQSATGNPVVVLLNGLHITPLMTRTYTMQVVP
jgi:Flp pilus assembly protein TadG